MNEGKFMIPFGSVFVICGIFMIGMYFMPGIEENSTGNPIVLIPFGGIFAIAGLAVMIGGIKAVMQASETLKLGSIYTGKIFRYESDPSMRINGRPALAPVVRFFDETGAIKEVCVKTGSIDQKKYAIGNTMQVAVYNNDAQIVNKTYRKIKGEFVPGQDRLMSPMEMSQRIGGPVLQAGMSPGMPMAGAMQGSAAIPEYNYNTGMQPVARDVMCPGCNGIVTIMPGSQVVCPHCGRTVGLTFENMIV